MAATPFSMRAVLLEHRERTRQSSKADIERFIEESQLKIISLESQISALLELCDRERARVATLRHIISPIHTLPVELLAEIFELTIRDDYMHEDVFRISQVCSDWRQFAHSTPRLWARPVQIDLRPSRSGDHAVDGLKAWLVRSAPLTIPITLRHGGRDHRIPDEVLRTAPRWYSLHLTQGHVRGYTPLSLISQLAGCTLESLEELILGKFTESDPTALPSLTTVPQLRKLSIRFGSNALPILMPWAQLTDLTLRADFPNIALDVLGQCANLIKAAVITAGWDVLPDDRQDILALSRLHSLSLEFLGSAGHVMPFLDYLSVPVLEELCLNFGDMGDDPCWTETCFTAFQLRAPNITQLELKYSDLTSDDLRTAVRHAPSLTHLKLTACHACFDDALIDALRYEACVRPLVPHLHNLYLHVGNNFTDDILAGMIASRWWTDTELASRSAPPAVSRSTHVALRGRSAQNVINIVRDLSPDVPIFHC
ncbi:hypothetical protein B0H12DRAFT_1230583 [Mycena haematopus]|nr:hypothetical protein B0H12DRAFT_1230583 [Mycena haematopus]